MNKAYFLVFIMLFSSHASADDMYELADESLKNYGFSYCLKAADTTKLSVEPARAMGGYFQMGSHDKHAYDNVQHFIDLKLQYDLILYADHALGKCLEIYHDPSYDKLIKQQRIYL